MSSKVISKEEIKTEIKNVFKEAAVDLFGKFLDNLSTDSFSKDSFTEELIDSTAENQLAPLVIAGIAVPPEYWDLKIKDLKYSNIQIAARITKILLYENITYINDFHRRDIELEKNAYFGKSTFKEFKSALANTIS